MAIVTGPVSQQDNQTDGLGSGLGLGESSVPSNIGQYKNSTENDGNVLHSEATVSKMDNSLITEQNVSEGTCDSRPVNASVSNDAGMQWRNPQGYAMNNYMMPPPMGPFVAYDPYWNGFMGYGPGPFVGPMLPFMGYGPGPFDNPYAFLPQDPFGMLNMNMNMMMPPPFPPQRDLSEMGSGTVLNVQPPTMNRELYKAQRADKRDVLRDREFITVMSSSNEDVSSQRTKPKPLSPSSNGHRSSRPSPPPHHHSKKPFPPHNTNLPSKRKSSDQEPKRSHHHHHHRSNHSARSAPKASAVSEGEKDRKQQKSRVFSRISFPEKEEAKKNKKGCSSESSDDEDMHFKRRKQWKPDY